MELIFRFAFIKFRMKSCNRTFSSPNNDAGHGPSNDPNDMNGILHKPSHNTTCNGISNEVVNNTTNPKLPAYVYRLGHSDRFAFAM